VFATLRRFNPAYAMRGFLLFAWNPLLQFELAGNAHNEALLICWMLLAIYLLVRERYVLSVLALTVAILIKFTPALLVPFFLVALWHAHKARPWPYRAGKVALALGAMGALSAAAYAPFGLNSITANASYLNSLGNEFHGSTSWMLNHVIQRTLGLATGSTDSLVRNFLLVVTVVAVLWRTWQLFRGSADSTVVKVGVLEGSFAVLFLYLLFTTPWFQPWHATWLLAFVPFVRRFGAPERTALFCFTALGNYFIWFYRWPIGSAIAEEAQLMMFWAMFALPLLFSVALWLYNQHKERAPGLPVHAAAYKASLGGRH